MHTGSGTAAAPAVSTPDPAPAPRASLPKRFLSFAVVGASGVAVNALLLTLMVEGLHWPVLLASLLSIEASTLSNWSLNRVWTWRDRKGGWASLGSYHMVALGGMAIQWTILTAATTTLHVHYLVGSLAGVAAATLWNFLGNDRLAFALRGPSAGVRRVMWYATSFAVQLLIAAAMTHPWDTFVFQKSVSDFLLHGTTPYQVASQAPGYIYSGESLPLTAQWYAYPPLPLLLMSATYAPVAFGAVTAPWLARILLKLPFLVGTLGFAWAARRLIATVPDADPAAAVRLADRAERWLLVNPLFLLIAGVWGQFEALLLMCLTLTVLAVRQQRWALAGAAYGAALLLKVFPVYAAPLLVVHAWRTGGWRAVAKSTGVAAALFAAITLPFYLVDPHGTVQQVLLMHAARPPARFAPVAALFVASQWVLSPPVSLDTLAAVFGRLSFAVTAVVITALAAAYAKKPATERNLLVFLAYTVTGGLLATKVFNEQYTLLPIGLLALVRFHPHGPHGSGARAVRKLLDSATWAMLAAALLDNFHVLAYLPPDVAGPLLHSTTPVAIRHVASAFGLSVANFLYTLGFLVRVVLLVPFSQAIRLMATPLKQGLAALEHGVERLPKLLRGSVPARTWVAAAALTAIVALPMSAAFAATPVGPGASASNQLGPRSVLAELRSDWFNPANDPAIASGTWTGVGLVPADGHYNTNAREVASDLATLRAAGVDAILVQLNPDYPLGAAAVRAVAEGDGMPYGLSVDLASFAGHDGRVALDDASARQARSAMGGPGAGWWIGHWHLEVDHHPVIALSDVALVQPGFTPGEHRFALQAYAAAHALSDNDAALVSAAAAA